MQVTIISDASHCSNTGAAGYAYWIASARGRMPGEGIAQRHVVNSCAAEMIGMVNALHKAMAERLVDKGDKVLFQCDSIGALDCLSGKRIPRTDQEVQIRKRFDHLVGQAGIKVKFRHVKGHTQNPANRSVTNRICDERARKNMKIARGRATLARIKELLDEQDTEPSNAGYLADKSVPCGKGKIQDSERCQPESVPLQGTGFLGRGRRRHAGRG